MLLRANDPHLIVYGFIFTSFFGIILILNLSIAGATPPVGTLMFTTCSISNVKIEDYIEELPREITSLQYFLAKIQNPLKWNIKSKNSSGRKGLKSILSLKNKRYISKEEWLQIDQEEIKRARKGSPRLKFTSHKEVFKFIDNI